MKIAHTWSYRCVGGYYQGHATGKHRGFWLEGGGQGPTPEQAIAAAENDLTEQVKAVNQGWRPQPWHMSGALSRILSDLDRAKAMI